MNQKLSALCGLATAFFVTKAQATTTVLLNDFASGYTDGNLIGPVATAANTVGQNGWSQTGAFAGGNPITVSNNQAVLASGATGQDAYKAFTSVVDSTVAGNYLVTRINFRITNPATTTGDYFFHLSSPLGTTSTYFQRLFSRAATGGFQLGINSGSNSSAAVWGSTVLTIDTAYEAVIKWDFIAGTTNDLLTVYVNPTDPVLTNNTVYTSANWTTTEPTTVAAANLRIGSSTTTPGVAIDSIQVQVIPEPGTPALIGLGVLSLLRRVRRI